MKSYTKKAKKFYDSKDWKSCRESFILNRINIDGGMCQHCKSTIGKIVDHIEELNDDNLYDPNITLNHQNLQYLCLPCSNRKTFFKDKRTVIFDNEGNPIFLENK